MKSYRTVFENKGSARMGIAFEPWGRMVYLENGESLVLEAYDYSAAHPHAPLLTFVHQDNEVLVYALDDASLRVIKDGEEIENMTYS